MQHCYQCGQEIAGRVYRREMTVARYRQANPLQGPPYNNFNASARVSLCGECAARADRQRQSTYNIVWQFAFWGLIAFGILFVAMMILFAFVLWHTPAMPHRF